MLITTLASAVPVHGAVPFACSVSVTVPVCPGSGVNTGDNDPVIGVNVPLVDVQ